MLSERNQSQKATYYMMPLTRKIRMDKFIEMENRLVFAWGWGLGGGYWKASANGYSIFFRKDDNVLELIGW